MPANESSGKPGLIIWGASGHGLVVADIVRSMGSYEIVAFYDNQLHSLARREFLGRPLLNDIEQIRKLYEKGTEHLIVAVGHCRAPLRLAEVARAECLKLAVAIHPKAIIAQDVVIGDGTVVVGGAVINATSSLGENVIINTSASVDHECVIEDGAHIGPGAHLGGRVHIGRAAWVGIGATVKDRVQVGANCIVGAGAVVLTDVPDNSVVVGVPARVIRKVEPDEN